MRLQLIQFYLLALFPLCLSAQEQYAVEFYYDAAGNQTAREYTCINCTDRSSEAKMVEKDEILQEDQEKKSLSDFGALMLYPNPVSQELNIRWINTESKKVKALSLYALSGGLLNKTEINEPVLQQRLDMSRYPSATYLLIVDYSDGTQQNLKVLKK